MPAQKQRGVPKRIAQTILHSLKGGVVPRIGLPYITVGRKAEIEALLHDFSVELMAGPRSTLLSASTAPGRVSCCRRCATT